MSTAVLQSCCPVIADRQALVAGRTGRVSLWAFVAFVVIWLFSLSRSLFDPIGYDQAMYQYMADRLVAGDRLYVDVWDQNGPGIVAIHWACARLIGSGPVALRLFDAGWQVLTLAALIGLAIRDGRRWLAGWLAAGLYVLAYYSLGYVQTAQREGFAVLPLLLSAHLVMGETPAGWRNWLRYLAAGALGLFMFSIKPPLGLAYGAIWIYTLLRNARRWREGVRAFAPLFGLTAGFMLAAGAAALLLVHLGSWDGFWGVLTRRDMPGYILGPALLRNVSGYLGTGGLLFIAVAGWAQCTRGKAAAREWTLFSLVGFGVFAILLTCRWWPDWRHVLACFAGLWIPAVGSIALALWRLRSESWTLCAVLLGATSAAVVLQGQFFLYHLPPMLATASYLGASEIDEVLSKVGTVARESLAWLAVCAGCVVYLAAGQWWPTMDFVTPHPYVLTGTDLSGHYTAITKHKLSCPTYATTMRVARRIQEMTGEDEPIATLFHEARIYYFAQRPCVHKLMAMQDAYRHMFGDYMQAIRDRRPKVIAARIPEHLRKSGNVPEIQESVFAEAETFFGAPGKTIRERYHVTELIDDVCLLTPR